MEPKIFCPFASCPCGEAMPRQQQQMDTRRTVQEDRQMEPRVDAERPPKEPPGRAIFEKRAKIGRWASFR
jgi:hypothetical protein